MNVPSITVVTADGRTLTRKIAEKKNLKGVSKPAIRSTLPIPRRWSSRPNPGRSSQARGATGLEKASLLPVVASRRASHHTLPALPPASGSGMLTRIGRRHNRAVNFSCPRAYWFVERLGIFLNTSVDADSRLPRGCQVRVKSETPR